MSAPPNRRVHIAKHFSLTPTPKRDTDNPGAMGATTAPAAGELNRTSGRALEGQNAEPENLFTPPSIEPQGKLEEIGAGINQFLNLVKPYQVGTALVTRSSINADAIFTTSYADANRATARALKPASLAYASVKGAQAIADAENAIAVGSALGSVVKARKNVNKENGEAIVFAVVGAKVSAPAGAFLNGTKLTEDLENVELTEEVFNKCKIKFDAHAASLYNKGWKIFIQLKLIAALEGEEKALNFIVTLPYEEKQNYEFFKQAMQGIWNI